MELKDLLRKKRLEKGLTLQEVADAANVSASTISRYERGDISNIKPKTITALSKKLDIPVTNFINMTDDPKANEAITTAVSAAVKDVVKDKLSDLLLQQFMATREDRVSDVGIEDAITEALRMPGKQHIYSYPLYGDIACGEPIYADDHIQGYVETVRKIGADFCIKAKGDSMVGDRICDGDLVFIRSQSMVENGEIAAVRIGGEATLKRVYYDRDKEILRLFPSNPAHKIQTYQGSELADVQILGKAVACQFDIDD